MPRSTHFQRLHKHFHIPDHQANCYPGYQRFLAAPFVTCRPNQSSEPSSQESFHGIYATWIHASVPGQHLCSPIYCTYVVNKHSHLQRTFETSLNHQGVKLQPVTKLRNHVDAKIGEHRPRTWNMSICQPYLEKTLGRERMGRMKRVGGKVV